MRALFTRRRRPAAGRSGVTFDEATSQVCDLECRADAAIERARVLALSQSFR
ncbi:hypothetical protein ACFV0L_37925 [Streptosporangium canum]|uniref:hypothetical protein n=1 Tax=Streptosporangium canum TaxID=324952 RepID=UPI0036C3AFEF